MGSGDIMYVAAFIVLPLAIVALSVYGLRTIGRRPLREVPLDEPYEQPTEALPIPPRDWAAVVRPTRGRAEPEQATQQLPERAFRPPAYRGRTSGVVRRVTRPAPRKAEAPVEPSVEPPAPEPAPATEPTVENTAEHRIDAIAGPTIEETAEHRIDAINEFNQGSQP